MLKLREHKGITLIALVITIIVLLILAGVTIAQLGENGLFNKTQVAKEAYTFEAAQEQLELDIANLKMEEYLKDAETVSPLNNLKTYLEGPKFNGEYEVELFYEPFAATSTPTTAPTYAKVTHLPTQFVFYVDGKLVVIGGEKGSDYNASIKYDANGGEGVMGDQSVILNKKATLKDNKFTKSGYAFVGWSLTADGEIIEDNKLDVTEEKMTVYAKWEESYTISFSAGDGATGEMNSIEAIKGSTITLPENEFTREDTEIFVGWKVGTTEYANKQEVTVNSNMEFVAQWSDGHTVTIDANNGTNQRTTTGVKTNNTITLPANTYTNGDKVFYRWNTQADGKGTSYKVGQTIKPVENMTLYAHWMNKIQGDDLLTIIKNTTFENDKIYHAGVGDEVYSMHVYNTTGDLEITSEVEYGSIGDVAHLDSATNEVVQASNMVVLKVNGNLNITSTGKLTAFHDTNYGGPKGMLIYVTGTLTNAGEINMTARGAYAEGQNVYLFKNANESYEFIPADKDVATDRLPGAGGHGANNREYGTGTRGGYATAFSGGAGGAGNSNKLDSLVMPSDKGGSGGIWKGSLSGMGNPSGGTGGTLIIYANNFNNTNKIVTNGTGAPYVGTSYAGGGSGGGSINIFFKSSTSIGTLEANGGAAGTSYWGHANGFAGENGSISYGNISTGTYVEDE